MCPRLARAALDGAMATLDLAGHEFPKKVGRLAGVIVVEVWEVTS